MDPGCSFCDSRAELVTRGIAAENENRLLRKAILELQAQRGEEQNASYTALLLQRIATLEANVARLTARKKAA